MDMLKFIRVYVTGEMEVRGGIWIEKYRYLKTDVPS